MTSIKLTDEQRKQIKEIRLVANNGKRMTREACAEIAKKRFGQSISAETIKKIESFDAYPDYMPKEKTLQLLCKVYDCTMDYLLGAAEYQNEEVRKAMCGFTEQDWIDDYHKSLKLAKSQIETATLIKNVLSLFDIDAELIPDETHIKHYRRKKDHIVEGVDAGTQLAIRTEKDNMRFCIPADRMQKTYNALLEFIYKLIAAEGYENQSTLYNKTIGGHEHWEKMIAEIDDINNRLGENE